MNDGRPRVRQTVPRPANARSGAAPAWAVLPPEARQGISLRRVRAAFDKTGPAWPHSPPGWVLDPESHQGMPVATAKPSAVLVVLFEEFDEVRVLLTRRSSRLRNHTGEVSFPGGRLEPGELALDAALREAAEEVGLDPALVDIIGELSPLATLSSGSAITPFVGVVERRPTLRPNPAEVELAFDVALTDLLADGVYWEELWQMGGLGERAVHFFALGEDVVWGATGRMLRELLDLVTIIPG